MDKADLGWVPTRLVHEVADWYHKFVDVALGKNMAHEEWILFQELPKKNQKFLEAFEFGGRPGKVTRLGLVNILQKTGKSIKDKCKFLGTVDSRHHVTEHVEATLACSLEFNKRFAIWI